MTGSALGRKQMTEGLALDQEGLALCQIGLPHSLVHQKTQGVWSSQRGRDPVEEGETRGAGQLTIADRISSEREEGFLGIGAWTGMCFVLTEKLLY